MSSVTDPHGRTISFTYNSTKQQGEWALATAVMPNGSTVSYAYTGGLLTGVSYPDGTTSSFTFTPDTGTGQMIVGYDDSAEQGVHRRKNAYLTNMFYLDVTEEQSYGILNQASNLITLLTYPSAVTSGTDEVAYMLTSSDFVTSTHYEGAGKMRQYTKGGSTIQVGYFTSWSIDATTGVVTGTLESSPVTLTYANDNLYRQGTLSQSIDEQGVVINYTTDSDGFPTVKTYSDSTTEKFSYDTTFKQVTRYEDRLHRVTLFTYDSQGNLTLTEVGILFDGTSDVHQPEYASYANSYYSSGAYDPFLLDTSTDANGNVTTYTYTPVVAGSEHLLATIVTPPDATGSPITAWTFGYDAYGRKISSTDAVGRETQYGYDTRDRQTLTTYADTSTEIDVYGTGTNKNLIVQHKDRQGKLTSFGYDNAGRMNSVTSGLQTMSADGSVTTNNDATLVTNQSLEYQLLSTYLAGTGFEATRSVNGNLTTNSFDYRQRIVSQTTYPTNAGGLTSSWIYINNLLAQTTDPYGRSTYMAYQSSDAALVRTVKGLVPSDGVGSASVAAAIARSSTTSNPPYLVTDYALDAMDQVTATIDPRGFTNTTTYDSRGRKTVQVADSTDTSTPSIVGTTSYFYDVQSNLIEIRYPRYLDPTDTEGYGKANTTMTYTHRNLLHTKQAAPSAPETGTQIFAYYPDGRIDTRTDENSGIWTTTWGACCGRIQGQLDPLVTLPGASSMTMPGKITRHNDYGDLTHEGVVSDYSLTSFPTISTPTNATDINDPSTVNEVTTAYDVRHRPIARTIWFAPLGTVDANNPPIAGQGGIPSTSGLTTTWRYDDNLTDSNGLSNTSDPDSVHPFLGGLSFGSNAAGSAMVEINPAGEHRWTIMDGVGRIVRVVDGNGNATTTAYDVVDGGGLVDTTVTDALSHAVTQSADASGWVRIITDQLGKLTTQSFDADGNIVAIRDPNGVGRNDTFDGRNRRTDSIDTIGSDTTWTFDLDNNTTKIVDPLGHPTATGHTTSYIFDARERKISMTDRVSGTTTFAYDPVSNLISITDADTNGGITTGGVTTYGYDARNLRITETYPPGESTPTPLVDERFYAYDAAHRLYSRVDQNSVTTQYIFDFVNRLTSRAYGPIGSAYATDAFTYDTASRLVNAASGLYPTNVARSYTDGGEKAGRLTSEVQTVAGSSQTIAYQYDMANRQTNVTYPDGVPVNRVFTNRDQLYSVGRTTGNYTNIVASIGYDDGMRRTSLGLGNSLTETRTYNADNTVNTIAEPGVTDYTYSYDADKNVTAETVGSGAYPVESLGYGYDTENRVTSWNRNTSTETQDWTLSLVGDWQATAKTGPNAFSQTRVHSAVHETTTITPTGASALALLYDKNGNLISDATNAQSYMWDLENRLTSVEASGVVVGSYIYDALGRRLQKAVDNTQTTFVNDGAQTISEYTAPVFHDADIGTVATAGTFAESGGVITMTASGDDIWNTADDFNFAYRQLTGDGSITALLISETATSSYTKAGVMIRDSLDPGAAEACMEFQYSESYPVFQYRDSDGSGTAQTSASSTWPEPIWLRIVRSGSTLYGYCSSDGVTWVSVGTQSISMGSTVYIGLALCAHDATADTTGIFENITTTGNVTSVDAPTLSNEYVYGSYIDEPLALITGGNTYFYADNRVYSPAALTDSSGTVKERYRYDSYGNRSIFAADDTTARTVSSYGNQRGFTGYYGDAESGLYYARARMYSPVLGRFIGRDPAGYTDSASLYSYCGNNPGTRTDPSGLAWVWTVTSRDADGTLHWGWVWDPKPDATKIDPHNTYPPEEPPPTWAWGYNYPGITVFSNDEMMLTPNVFFQVSEAPYIATLNQAIIEVMQAENRGRGFYRFELGAASLLMAPFTAGASLLTQVTIGASALDQMATGINNMATSQNYPSFTNRGVTYLTGSPSAGQAAELLLPFTGGFTSLAWNGLFPASETRLVTTWASTGVTPDFNYGRWVILGGPSPTNFILTGLPGPKGTFTGSFPWFKLSSSDVPFGNSASTTVLNTQLKWPGGCEWPKGLLGQRQIK